MVGDLGVLGEDRSEMAAVAHVSQVIIKGRMDSQL